MSAHARLGPSGASRWTTCPGAPRLEEGIESKDSKYSLQGTAAHQLLEDLLLGNIEKGVVAAGIEVLGVTLQADDINAVLYAFDYIQLRGAGASFIYSEMQVNPGIYMQRDDCWGTLDCIIGHPDGTIEVIDYKHGAGVAVDVTDNKQLLLYALGAYQFLAANEIAVENVVITILQPRAHHVEGPVRTQVMTGTALIAEWLPYFTACAAATDHPEAPLVQGEDQCRWCNAKATCPQLADASLAAARGVFEPVATLDQTPESQLAASFTESPDALGADKISFILEHESLIKGWLSAVHAHAHELLMAGTDIPGFKIVNGRKSKSWTGTEDEILDALAKLPMIAEKGKKSNKIGKARLQTISLLSPAQVIKVIKPSVTKETWDKISTNILINQGAPVIAPLSDRRAALPMKASEVFEPVTSEPANTEALPDFLN